MTQKSGSQEKELDKLQKQFENFDDQVKSMSNDINKGPSVEDTEPQTKLSSREIANSKDIYLKPIRRIGSQEQFNERFRSEYEFSKELVHFTAENKEIVGESIEPWTKPFPGMPAEQWRVPVNTPVWGPRYLAEQIRRKYYNRLTMKEDSYAGQDSMGTYTGQLVVEKKVARLTAEPVVGGMKSVFMGKSGF